MMVRRRRKRRRPRKPRTAARRSVSKMMMTRVGRLSTARVPPRRRSPRCSPRMPKSMSHLSLTSSTKLWPPVVRREPIVSFRSSSCASCVQSRRRKSLARPWRPRFASTSFRPFSITTRRSPNP
uniref:(northern house mosquito) hypothetical protein n=1 Tax=Culex pipiens TaxID=7175 RepID=A0A8D8JED5_CULPI